MLGLHELCVLYRGKDTLLGKRNSVVVKKHQFEFVANNWIIVDHWKSQISQTQELVYIYEDVYMYRKILYWCQR